ncbi:MAG: DUF2752 domain-containing protein [Ignavibacteriaceae bacterium]|nr:DUF2752 domain-containing protein [Ignavibacteriaceae bacterium]
MNLKRKIKLFPLEAIIWISGLVYLLFFVNPSTHFSICPFSNFGFEYCPGCGLGRSISLLSDLKFWESIRTHPLGIIAFILLLYRSISIILIYRRRITNI